MVRFFPRAGARASRAPTGIAVGCLLIAGLLTGTPSAQGREDDGRSRPERVEKRIDRAQLSLDHVSQQLLDATAALDAAEARLAQAQETLAAAEGELLAAEAIDQQLQAQLVAAEQRLVDARADLAAGEAKVARQRRQVATLVVEQFQGENPQLMGLSAVLNATSPLQLSNQMAAVDSVLTQGSASLDRLQAARALLSVQQDRVARAKREVAEQREAAARNLVRTEQARQQAVAAERTVAALVARRSQAQAEARAAVRVERLRLAVLRKERERVAKLLIQRAERQSRRLGGLGVHGPTSGYLDFPVYGPVTSSYGMRLHPILNIVKLHDGMDFGAPCGSAIRAAAGGVVLSSYYNAGYGKRLILGGNFVHGTSLSTSYNHLSRAAVKVGDRVKRGQVIGYVGSTGYSTGCHLHFMVYENGLTVDPLTWL